MQKTRVKDVMHRGVITCFPDKSLKEAARIMLQNDISTIVVIDQTTLEVRGVVSDYLLVQSHGADLDKTVVGDILLPYTVTISPESTLTKAIELMQQKKIRNLVIIEGEGYNLPRWPVGIVSCSDIVREMAGLPLVLPGYRRR